MRHNVNIIYSKEVMRLFISKTTNKMVKIEINCCNLKMNSGKYH